MKKGIPYLRLFLLFFFLKSFIIHSTAQITCDSCTIDLVNFIETHKDELLARQWSGNCDLTSEIHHFGSVNIGTSSHSGRLTVKNGILTDKVKVAPCGDIGWCDYVFEENYPLKSIEEVQCYVEENGHLPNTPSAAQIKKDGGFELGAITFNQQEKIEEIFLYLIHLKKEADALKRKFSALKKENQRLKAIACN